jgi:catechol 2,3-dioxygenase-like lactoylglutathione lyase family enzyme
MRSPDLLLVSCLHHVSLRVRDLDRSIAFYRDGLGCPLKSAFELRGRRFAMLETGASGGVELVETGANSRPSEPGDVLWHLALCTEDIEGSLSAAREAGAEITLPITSLDLMNAVTGEPYRVRIAFFRGLDGEEVELIDEGDS